VRFAFDGRRQRDNAMSIHVDSCAARETIVVSELLIKAPSVQRRRSMGNIKGSGMRYAQRGGACQKASSLDRYTNVPTPGNADDSLALQCH
jgi:hypothetical protein